MQPTLLFAKSTPVSRENHAHEQSSDIASDKLLREYQKLPQEKAAVNATGVQLVTQEMRYHMPEAEEVFLVWGINGWSVVPAAIRPAGTVVQNGIMHTPMERQGETFVAKVQTRSGSIISYGFLITKQRNGDVIHPIWDGDEDYYVIPIKDSVTEVQASLTSNQEHTSIRPLFYGSLVTQEMRYRMPEAEEVFLAWGINFWSVVPAAIRPAGTVVQNGVMLTPMTPEGDHFVTKIQVPSSATISYGFLITKAQGGTPMKPVWDGDRAYHTMALQNGVIEVKPKLKLSLIQEVRYHMPEAEEVFLVWGINGWSVVPAAIRPAGTVVQNGIMHTPMAREGNHFVAKVQVLTGTVINYGFLINAKRHDTLINPIWDGKQDYHRVVTQEHVIEVKETQIHTPEETPRLWLQLLLGMSIAVGIGTILKRTLQTL
jgi:threonine dehydrogenase-like Zn-dependent dehydrogenase